MTDDIKAAEKLGYSKGYAAGIRRSVATESRRNAGGSREMIDTKELRMTTTDTAKIANQLRLDSQFVYGLDRYGDTHKLMSDAADTIDALTAELDHLRDAAKMVESLKDEIEALRADAERIDWIIAMLDKHSSVVFLPCGEQNFVQIRHFGEVANHETLPTVREAIDAAIKPAPSAQELTNV